MKNLTFLSLVASFAAAATSWAQVLSPNEAGVAMGHFHTIVRNVETTKKFWLLLGGVPIKVDGTEVLKFPGVLIFLEPGSPSGGSGQTRNGLFEPKFQTTAVDHFGFNMTNGKELMAKIRAAGVKVDSIEGRGPDSGYIWTPDGLRVEMSGSETDVSKRFALGFSPDLDVPVASDHIHYYLPQSAAPEAQAWYGKLFGAKLLKENNRCQTASADIPGIRLRFCGSGTSAFLPTKGRALDHIGFEVKNLEAFCKKLEATGIKFDLPYSTSRHKSFASAQLTDPWGTSIELTEGLNQL